MPRLVQFFLVIPERPRSTRNQRRPAPEQTDTTKTTAMAPIRGDPLEHSTFPTSRQCPSKEHRPEAPRTPIRVPIPIRGQVRGLIDGERIGAFGVGDAGRGERADKAQGRIRRWVTLMRHRQRRHHRLLGQQQSRTDRRALRHIQSRVRRQGTHMRHTQQQHHRLLGQQRQEPSDRALGHIQGRVHRPPPFVRRANCWPIGVLGRNDAQSGPSRDQEQRALGPSCGRRQDRDYYLHHKNRRHSRLLGRAIRYVGHIQGRVHRQGTRMCHTQQQHHHVLG